MPAPVITCLLVAAAILAFESPITGFALAMLCAFAQFVLPLASAFVEDDDGL
jgi:hypothetical protein